MNTVTLDSALRALEYVAMNRHHGAVSLAKTMLAAPPAPQAASEPASVAGLSGDAEREVFEAWYSKRYAYDFSQVTDTWKHAAMCDAWEVWQQARAALHSTGKPDGEGRLTKEARVGHAMFGVGVPERFVIEAAQRAAEHPQGLVDKEVAAGLHRIIQENAERAAFLDAHPAVTAELAALIEENERLRATLPAVQPEAETSAEKAVNSKVPDGFIDDILTCASQFNDAIRSNNKAKIEANAAWMNDLIIRGARAAQADAPVAEPVAPDVAQRVDGLLNRFALAVQFGSDQDRVAQGATLRAHLVSHFTHPPARDEAKDAARYRWLRDMAQEVDLHEYASMAAERWDEAVDKDMSPTAQTTPP